MKRDKQFEDWYWNEFGQFEDGVVLECFQIEEGAYYRLGTRMAFAAWQASRQALEIALPVLEQKGADINCSEWISCSKRLPKEDGQYWGWWSEEKRQGPVWFIERQSQFQSYQITHWMPLPAPPDQQASTTPQIDNDGWIEWRGGECPVNDNAVVRVRYRGEFQADTCIAGSMIWEHSGEEGDIIAYRVIESDGSKT